MSDSMAETILRREQANEAERKRLADEQACIQQKLDARRNAQLGLCGCDSAILPERVVRFAAIVNPWPDHDSAKLSEGRTNSRRTR